MCGVDSWPSIETGKYRIIALTNNFSKTDTSILGDHPPPGKYGGIKVTLESELKFLGWTNGAVPPGLRALFDDFVDSSEIGMRYVHGNRPYHEILGGLVWDALRY